MGKVFVYFLLDCEIVLLYKLNVSVFDGLYINFVILNIIVFDINDNFLVCIQFIIIVYFSEDVVFGIEVFVVEVIDLDVDDDGKLRYFVFGQGIGVFIIENGIGELCCYVMLCYVVYCFKVMLYFVVLIKQVI